MSTWPRPLLTVYFTIIRKMPGLVPFSVKAWQAVIWTCRQRGGEINPDKLDASDTEGLKRFYKMLYGQETPIPYKTRMDKNEVWAFAEKILERIEMPI
jgi:hypothetical protein